MKTCCKSLDKIENCIVLESAFTACPFLKQSLFKLYLMCFLVYFSTIQILRTILKKNHFASFLKEMFIQYCQPCAFIILSLVDKYGCIAFGGMLLKIFQFLVCFQIMYRHTAIDCLGIEKLMVVQYNKVVPIEIGGNKS